MKSELTDEFIKCFLALPERVQETARKNYKLWQRNPAHPSLEFKKLKTRRNWSQQKAPLIEKGVCRKI